MDDQQLLEEFATSGSQTSFREIVRRHIDLVYAACKRRVKDTHLAEDATQAVFAILARRARSISGQTVLAGWLYQTARYVSANTLRMESYRRRREMAAARQARNRSTSSAADLSEIDDALERLSPQERNAILLHYIEGRSHREVGNALGVSEEAARKRISRALERLRQHLTRAGGEALSVAALALLLGKLSQSAPSALIASTAAAATGAASASATALAKGAILMAAISKTKSILAAAVVVLLLSGSAAFLIHLAIPPAANTQAIPTVSPNAPVKVAAAATALAPPFPHTDPSYASFPYAKGFPIAVPGSITGSPAIADLDGDGKYEIVVPVVGRQAKDLHRYDAAVHPNSSLAAHIFAFRADGSLYPNFPVLIRNASYRAQRDHIDWMWNFSPSIANVDHNKTDELIFGPRVLYGDGTLLIYANLHENYGSATLADIDKDGEMDIVMGWFAASTLGAPIRGWPLSKNFFPGYSPAIGDVDGDGDLEIFHPHRASEKIFCGYDHLMRPLPGWPRPMSNVTMYPVIGDMDGDGKAEIAVMDEGNRLFIWHHDGRPVAASKTLSGMDGVFKDGMYAMFTHPAMADLDGDGKAELLILDWTSKSIRAWKIDGSPAVPHDPSRPDGFLFELPPQKNSGYGAAGGISVADLGADGVMDIFCGTSWWQLRKDGSSRRIDMTPGHPQSTTVPTIADLDRDGVAEVLFGTTDGRLFVYNTKMAYESELIEWPTQEGDFQHTGMWRAPSKR
jgi:RNA polymerase sigma factor (sigma-70 family)